MPIKLQDHFPAKDMLERETIFSIEQTRALRQDIRPLRIVILNLMPNKIDTEVQLLRLISKTPLQIEVDFLKMTSHVSKSSNVSHLKQFYQTFEALVDQYYDGMIITGAPVEQLDFQAVDYWAELCEVMKWSQHHVFSTVHICWGAQAGLYYHYGIEKVNYPKKLFGIYRHYVSTPHFLVTGFDDVFDVPQSRYTGINERQVADNSPLEIVARSAKAGVNLLADKESRQIFMLGHLEYDADTLEKEYQRDREKGLDPQLPYRYFQSNDPTQKPLNTWKAHANLFYHNWLNHVYQQTPYELEKLDR